jgi:transposase
MTYSTDFIEHILATRKNEKLSLRKTAKRFGVGICTIQRWERGELPTRKRKRAPRKISNEALLQDVEKYPDDYQYERAMRLSVSQRGIGYALARLKITRKKRPCATQKPMKPSASNTN